MYLIQNGLLCKHYQDHVKRVSQELKEASLEPFRRQQLPVQHICGPKANKEEIARDVATERGIREGNVCALTAMDNAVRGGRSPPSERGLAKSQQPLPGCLCRSRSPPAFVNLSSRWNSRASTAAAPSARYAHFNLSTRRPCFVSHSPSRRVRHQRTSQSRSATLALSGLPNSLSLGTAKTLRSRQAESLRMLPRPRADPEGSQRHRYQLTPTGRLRSAQSLRCTKPACPC